MIWPLFRPAPVSCRYQLPLPAYGGSQDLDRGKYSSRNIGAGHVAWDWSAHGAYTNLTRPSLVTYDCPLPFLTGDVRHPLPDPCPPSPDHLRDPSVVQHLARSARSYSDVPRLAIDCTLPSFVLSTFSPLPAASLPRPETCLGPGPPTRLSFSSFCCWAKLRPSALAHPPTILLPTVRQANKKQNNTIPGTIQKYRETIKNKQLDDSLTSLALCHGPRQLWVCIPTPRYAYIVIMTTTTTTKITRKVVVGATWCLG